MVFVVQTATEVVCEGCGGIVHRRVREHRANADVKAWEEAQDFPAWVSAVEAASRHVCRREPR